MERKRSKLLSGLALAGAAFLTLAGCGGSDNGTSPESLKSRLLPVSAVPSAPARAPRAFGPVPQGVRVPRPPTSGGRFTVERYFAWKNPIDVVVEGVFLPEATRPSEAIDVVKKNKFDAGAGELLTTTGNGPRLMIDALEFKSVDDARKVQHYLHGQDLQQPCFKVCSADVSNLKLNGVPGATAAQQVPMKKLPPNAPPPFDHYVFEFTVGPFLYIGDANGGPGDVPKALFVKGAKVYYDRVKNL